MSTDCVLLGVEWILSLWGAGLGGVLADDMVRGVSSILYVP